MSAALNCYTLLGGQFIGPDYTAAPVPVLDSEGNPVKDRRTGVALMKLPSRKTKMTETVVSPYDLVAKHVNQFAYKGPYIAPVKVANANTPEGGTPATTATVVPSPATSSDPFYTEAELNEMTVADLTNLASEEEIDLGGATKKADIVKALLAAKS